MRLELHQTSVIPFDSSDFSSIRMSFADSINYVAFFDSTQDRVLLYSSTNMQSQMIKSWHTDDKPGNIAVSSELKRIYFLNRSQSYVSVHNF